MPSHEDLLNWLLTAWVNKELRREQLREQVLDRMRAADPVDCVDCGTKVPRGQGLGKSGDDWPDKSKPRPIVITPLCKACMSKRMHHE